MLVLPSSPPRMPPMSRRTRADVMTMTEPTGQVPGQLTPVLDRIGALFDAPSVTVNGNPRAAAFWAVGQVDGTEAVAFATDPTIHGGALDRVTCDTIIDAYAAATARSCPIVGVWQSGGA